MSNKKNTYPLYRKYANEKSYFKVLSETMFEEIQLFGKKTQLFHFTAKILPDRNYIYDLTYNDNKHILLCSKQEFENLKKTIQ